MAQPMPPYMVTMTLLIDGALQYDYGDGSCLSCGGVVLAINDKAGKRHEACEVCGPVEYVALVNDAGYPVQGFFSTADFAAYCGHLPNLDDVPY